MSRDQAVTKSFEGIRQVDIVNSSETVRIQPSRSKSVRLKGAFRRRPFGLTRWDDTLYLIGFEGSLAVPDEVALTYKRGVRDIQRELYDTYAPDLPYKDVAERETLVRSLSRYRDVPSDQVLEIIRRFTQCTSSPFFTRQTTLDANPAVLQLRQRQAKADQFRWDGRFRFLPNIQANQHAIVPEIASAATVDQAIVQATRFMVNQMSVRGEPWRILLREMDVISRVRDAPELSRRLLQIQADMAKMEAETRALITTVTKRNTDTMLALLKEFEKKRIPYATTLVQHFAGTNGPISQFSWLGVIAETAARELKSQKRSKDGGSVPSTSATTATTHAALREGHDAVAALQAGQQVTVCIHEVVATNLKEIDAQLKKKQEKITKEQAVKWIAKQKDWEDMVDRTHRARWDKGEQHFHTELKPQKEKNEVIVKNYGEKYYKDFHPPPPPDTGDNDPWYTRVGKAVKRAVVHCFWGSE